MSATAIRAGGAYVELFTKDGRLVRGLSKARMQLQSFATFARTVGTSIATAGGAATAVFGLSGRVFAEFEDRMQRVKALTGATGKDFADLTALAEKLGRETVFTARDAADAMSFFALAGFKVDQILSAMPATLELAAAGKLEVAQAADIAAKIMAGMGIEANRLGSAIDVLVKGMTTANTDLVQLGDAMKYVGPVAKQAGYSLEETVAAVQLLSNAGIQADMAGTTLRGAILSLTDPSKEAATLLASLGISTLDAAGNMRPLAAIIDDLNDATAEMGSGERLGIIGKIFDARQAAGFAELMSQGGQRLRDATAALQNSAGTGARIARTQLDSLRGDAVILESALEGVAVSIGRAFVKPLRAALQWITQTTLAVQQWVDKNRGLTLTLAIVSGAVVTIGAGLIGLGIAAAIVSTSLTFIAGALTTVGGILAFVGAKLAAIATPIGLLIAGGRALGVTWLSQSGAIGRAVGWLRAQFDRLAARFGETFRTISALIQEGQLGPAMNLLWTALKATWAEGVAFLRVTWIRLQAAVVNAVLSAVAAVAGAFGITIDNISNAWVDLQIMIADVTWRIGSTWALMTEGLVNAWDDAMVVVAAIVAELQATLAAAVAYLSELAAGIAAEIAAVVEALSAAVQSAVNWITRAVYTALAALESAFRAVLGPLTAGFQWLMDQISVAAEWFYSQFAFVFDWLVESWRVLETAFADFVGFLTKWWTRFTTDFRGAWIDAQTEVAHGIAELWGMFDDSVDVGFIHNELQQNNARAHEELRADDAAREQRLAEIDAQRSQRRADVEKFFDPSARRAQAQQDIDAARAEAAQATAQWQQALDEAKRSLIPGADEEAAGQGEAHGLAGTIGRAIRDSSAAIRSSDAGKAAENKALELGTSEALSAILNATTPEERWQRQVAEYERRIAAASERSADRSDRIARSMEGAAIVTAGIV